MVHGSGLYLSLTALVLCAGCEPCMGRGPNGVPDPALDEFQLVFNNIVSRNTDLYVDGARVATLCEETEYITVGNFPANPGTTIVIQDRLGGGACSISPCCDSHCNAQTCFGSPMIDTTPFGGRVFITGLIWEWN